MMQPRPWFSVDTIKLPRPLNGRPGSIGSEGSVGSDPGLVVVFDGSFWGRLSGYLIPLAGQFDLGPSAMVVSLRSII